MQKMSSLVERLRVRSDRRPVYNLDDSDDDADLAPGKRGNAPEAFEKIDRSDAVHFCSYHCYFFKILFGFIVFLLDLKCIVRSFVLNISFNVYFHPDN